MKFGDFRRNFGQFSEGKKHGAGKELYGFIDAQFEGTWHHEEKSKGIFMFPDGTRWLRQVIPELPSLFTLLRPYLAHFFPENSRFFARFHRLAEAVPTSPKPESRAKKQCQGRPNTVLPA